MAGRIVITVQVILGPVDPALAEGLRQPAPSQEECPQQVNRVDDVEMSAVVGVGGIEAGDRPALEQVAEEENRVGEIQGTVGIDIPPGEVNNRRGLTRGEGGGEEPKNCE